MHELNEDTSKSDLGHSDTFENHVKFPNTMFGCETNSKERNCEERNSREDK
jgi:hypothetical protein